MEKSFWNKIIKVIFIVAWIGIGQSCSSSGKREPSLSADATRRSKKVETDRSKSANQISVISWNLAKFGYSKNDEKIKFIADVIKDYDIVAIQEVVGKRGGADAIIRLVHELDSHCNPCKWDYEISKLTSGSTGARERYAYLWKGNKVNRIGLGHLDQYFEQEIEREPFLLTFRNKHGEFTLVNFHALPKSKQPEKEIKFLKYFPELYPKKKLIFVGDFNVPQSHTVFNPLKKMGYKPVLTNQKTTLRQECFQGDCLASEYDNVFYPAKEINLIHADVVHFYNFLNQDMKKARKISDHIPVTFTFSLK